MQIIELNDPDNEYRDQLLELLAENNEESTPPIAELARDILADDGDKLSFREAIELYYDELTDDIVLAIDDDEVAGFFMLQENDQYFKERAPDHWPSLAVTQALVADQYRRQGVASELLQYTLEEICPGRDMPHVVWATSSANDASQGFIESYGFEQVTTVEDDRGEGIHTYIYARTV